MLRPVKWGLALLIAVVTPAWAQTVRVPLSCRVLAKLNGIDTPVMVSIEEAEQSLAQAENHPAANTVGIRFCLRAAHKAIDRAKAKEARP